MATPDDGGLPQSSDTDGNQNATSTPMNLPLIIGLAVAALVVMIVIILLVLWRTGKLRKRKRNVLRPGGGRKDRGNDTLREERKKSIIVVAPSNREGAELYIVRHFYQAEDDNQLTLESGRIVEVVEKMDNGWWRGVVGDQEGWFPATFVKKIDVSEPVSVGQGAEVTETTGPETGGQCQDVDKEETDGSYVNGGYSKDTVDKKRSSSRGKAKKETEKEAERPEQKGVEHSDSMRINSMQNEDIEGYLNEIFSVEDETTPETPRRTPKGKHHKASKNKAHSLLKKKKDQENTKKFKEQSLAKKTQIENIKNAKNGKISHVKQRSLDSIDQVTSSGVKGSPLINPVHYMISSSESLISSSSCFEEPEKVNKVELPDFQKTEVWTDEKQATSPLEKTEPPPPARTDQDVPRGAPDGSSLQDVLPDRKELTCTAVVERDDGLEGDVDNTDESQLDKSTANTDLSFASNLKDHLQTRARRRSYVAMYPFSAGDETQLSLSRNDVIYALSDVNNGWIKGEKKDTKEIGWFPENFTREGKPPPGVDVMSEESEALDSDGEFEDDDQTGLEYRVLYSYTAQQEGDLSITEGDTVVVMETLDNGWWRGCQGDQEGWFPGTYVEPVPQTPSAGDDKRGATSPFQDTLPLSTSSPIENGDEKKKRQSLPAQLEDVIVADVQNHYTSAPPSEESKTHFNFDSSSKLQQNKRTSMPPLTSSSKPEVPRRFVTPKLVQMPKRTRHRKDGHKVNVKPSRPPPPVPKSGPGVTAVTPSGEGVVMRQKSDQGTGSVVQSRRRESVPRPSVPPPPAPVQQDPEQLLPVSSGDLEKSPLETQPQALDSESNLDTTEAVDDDFLKQIKKNSLPGVHRGITTRNGDTIETQNAYNCDLHNDTGAQGDIKSSTVKVDQDSNNTGEIKQTLANDSSLSFNAIMTIFEKIADKADYSLSSLDHVDIDEKDSDKPQPPEEEMLQFRRSKSDPDLMRPNSTGSLSLPQSENTAGHDLGYQGQGHTKEVRPSSMMGSNKPALPPRPKVITQRSKSCGSLKVSKDLTLNSNPDLSTNHNGAKDNLTVKTNISHQNPIGSDHDVKNRQPNVNSAKAVEHDSTSRDIAIHNKVQSDVEARRSKINQQNQKGQSGLQKLDIPAAQGISVKNDSPSSTPPPRPQHPPSVSPQKLHPSSNRSSRGIGNSDEGPHRTESKTTLPVEPPLVVHQVSPGSDRQRIISNSSLKVPSSPPELSVSGPPTSNGNGAGVHLGGDIPVIRDPVSSTERESVHIGRGIYVVGDLAQTSSENTKTGSRIIDKSHSSPTHRSSDSQEVMINSTPYPQSVSRSSDSMASEEYRLHSGSYPSLVSPTSQIHKSPTRQPDTSPSNKGDPSPTRHVTSPLNIKTNPMRFFSPMGFSKSPSSSSVSSATTLSPLTLSPISTDNSMNISSGDITSSGESTLKHEADRKSRPRINTIASVPVVHSHIGSVTRGSSTENLYRKPGWSTTSDSLDPLRFYTPPGYITRPGSIGHLDKVGGYRPSHSDSFPSSLPSLHRGQYPALDSGDEDFAESYRNKNLYQRNSDTAKLYKINAGHSINADQINNGQCQIYSSSAKDRNRNNVTNGYLDGYHVTNGNLEKRPPTPSQPSLNSKNITDQRPWSETRNVKIPMSHQLKLVALKNEDLESDV